MATENREERGHLLLKERRFTAKSISAKSFFDASLSELILIAAAAKGGAAVAAVDGEENVPKGKGFYGRSKFSLFRVRLIFQSERELNCAAL